MNLILECNLLHNGIHTGNTIISPIHLKQLIFLRFKSLFIYIDMDTRKTRSHTSCIDNIKKWNQKITIPGPNFEKMKTVKNSYTTYQTQGVDRRFLDSHCPSHLSQSHLLLVLYIKLPYKHLSKNFSRKSLFAHNFCACTRTFTPQFLISTPCPPSHMCTIYSSEVYVGNGL